MPGLLASTHKPDAGWVYNLRDTSAYDTDSDSETIEDRTTAAANKRTTSHAKLLKELDLSAREDNAIYKPTPWTIAKLNSACRPSSYASFAAPGSIDFIDSAKASLSTTSTTNRNVPSASFLNKTCNGVSVKSVQTTLDRSFTVEKAGVTPKRILSKAAKLPLRYDNWDSFTNVKTGRRTDGQFIPNPATVSVPEKVPVSPEDTSLSAPSTLLHVYNDDPEFPCSASKGKGDGTLNLSVSVDPIVPVPSEQTTQEHACTLSDYPDYLSEYSVPINPVVSIPSEQTTQEHTYMRSDYQDYLPEEYSIETNDIPENDRTELLDEGARDAAVGNEWARTLKYLREELLTPSSNTRGLDHTRGIIDPAQDWLSESYALSDHVSNASSNQYPPKSSDQNSRDATLLPSFPSVKKRSYVKTLSPLQYSSNRIIHPRGLDSRLAHRSEDELDPDSAWSTLPTRRRRNKPVKTRTFFKHSGTFKLPVSALRSTKSLAMDRSVVVGTTENLPNGKQLTFYKPPPRKQSDAGDEPVILRIRKGSRQDWK